ncbi:hypothetical protein D3C85_552650 [compost metagenome]
MQPYLIVEAYLSDLPHTVNKLVAEGYIPIGGPFQGKKGISEHYMHQAMFRAAAVTVIGPEVPDVTPVGTFGTIGDRAPEPALDADWNERPEAQFDFRDPHEHAKFKKDVLRLDLVLLEPDRLHRMTPHDFQELLATSEYVLNIKLRHLRLKQQEPYRKYTEAKTEKEVLAKLQDNRRLGNGVLEEFFAAERARDPSAKPRISVSAADARLIASLLEENYTRAQYPSDHQAAATRFINNVKARQ